MGGFVLCAALVSADYGSTQAALRRPNTMEVGPVARHSLPLGAAIKGGACVGVEVLGRKSGKKAKWVRRGVEVALTGLVVAHNLRQGR